MVKVLLMSYDLQHVGIMTILRGVGGAVVAIIQLSNERCPTPRPAVFLIQNGIRTFIHFVHTYFHQGYDTAEAHTYL
jgi:hypothetical protein